MGNHYIAGTDSKLHRKSGSVFFRDTGDEAGAL